MGMSTYQYKLADPELWKCSSCTDNTTQLECCICKNIRYRWILLKCNKCNKSFHRACYKKTNDCKNETYDKWTYKDCMNHHMDTFDAMEQDCPIKKAGLLIGHLNVRDLMTINKKQDLEILMQKHKFDIFGVTET